MLKSDIRSILGVKCDKYYIDEGCSIDKMTFKKLMEIISDSPCTIFSSPRYNSYFNDVILKDESFSKHYWINDRKNLWSDSIKKTFENTFTNEYFQRENKIRLGINNE